MLLKAGVDISRLGRPIRRALSKISRRWPDFVVTSTYEGTHAPGSLHYANLAIDLRHTTFEGKKIAVDELRDILGHDYDIVEEASHIHIEYDPEEG